MEVNFMYEFPYELKIAIEGLNNSKRQKILLILENEDKLSFSEIKKKSEIAKTLLVNHLKKLSRSLLIEHFYEHEIGKDSFSYYRITPLGAILLHNILETLVLEQQEIGVERFIEHLTLKNNVPSTRIVPIELKSKNKVVATSEEPTVRKFTKSWKHWTK